MGLPTCQQRILDTIEGKLAQSDPRLTALFAIFSRLTRTEAMPWFEQLKVRPIIDLCLRLADWCRRTVAWCGRLGHRPAARVRALVLLPAALTAMACALTLAFGFSGNGRSVPGASTQTSRQVVAKHRMCWHTLVRVPVLAC